MNISDERISGRQLTFLLISTLFSTQILVAPVFVIQEAKQDAWLSVILGIVFGLLLGIILVTLGRRFPRQTIIEYSREIAGRLPGSLWGLSYIFMIFYTNVLIIRDIAEPLKNDLFTKTPLEVIAATIILSAAYIIRRGLEVLCRTNEILLPFVVLIILGGIGLVFKDLNFSHLLPVFSNGTAPVLKGFYRIAFFIAEINLILLILPALGNKELAPRAMITAVVSAGLLHAVLATAIFALLGLGATDHFYPAIDLFRYIRVGGIIERQEALLMAIGTGASLVKVGFYYYCICLAAACWAGLRDFRPLVYPVGVLLVLFSVIGFSNVAVLRETVTKIIPAALFIQGGVPLLLLIVSLIRKRGGSAGEKAG